MHMQAYLACCSFEHGRVRTSNTTNKLNAKLMSIALHMCRVSVLHYCRISINILYTYVVVLSAGLAQSTDNSISKGRAR